MKFITSPFWILTILITLFSCSSEQGSEKADLLFFNGNVVTMTGENEAVESVAVLNGNILDCGAYEDLEQYKGEETKVIDLHGKTMMPGFIDAHSHLTQGIYELTQANVSSPPVGVCSSIPNVLEELMAYKKENGINDGEWILGYGYDNELLKEKRHPNRYELDSVFPNNPVVIGHVSLHMGVCNSKVLDMLGFDDDTEDPLGGHIGRNEDGQLTGLLQENAAFAMMSIIPQITLEEKIDLLDDILDNYASNGYTTIQDGVSNEFDLEFLRQGQMNNDFFLDVVSLPDYANFDKLLKDSTIKFGEYDNGLKYGGIKIIGDGSPQGKTAFFKHAYCSHGDCNDTSGFRGQPNLSQQKLDDVVKKAYDNGIQVNMHCNGDGAIDMLIKAHEKVSINYPKNDFRTVIIHAQFINPEQLKKIATLGFIPSYFTNHAYFWGDAHLNNLGEERANFLSPIASSDKLGITYTNHTDYLITPLNPMFTVWTAVNRLTRNNVVLGDQEKATVYQAFKAITINAAYQYFEEDSKGSIEKGKLADFVILSDNPFEVEEIDLKNIKVLETIKEGKTVFKL
jgi:predicted amidohydrolase YtcJ